MKNILTIVAITATLLTTQANAWFWDKKEVVLTQAPYVFDDRHSTAWNLLNERGLYVGHKFDLDRAAYANKFNMTLTGSDAYIDSIGVGDVINEVAWFALVSGFSGLWGSADFESVPWTNKSHIIMQVSADEFKSKEAVVDHYMVTYQQFWDQLDLSTVGYGIKPVGMDRRVALGFNVNGGKFKVFSSATRSQLLTKSNVEKKHNMWRLYVSLKIVDKYQDPRILRFVQEVMMPALGKNYVAYITPHKNTPWAKFPAVVTSDGKAHLFIRPEK